MSGYRAIPGFRVLLVLCLCLPLTFQVSAAVPPSKFKQPFFAIGAFWLTFTEQNDLDACFKDIADANFTVVYGPVVGGDDRLVELCRKYGMAAIMNNPPADRLPIDDACWGYRVTDEPSAAYFPELQNKAKEFRLARPGMLDDVTLFPNYARPGQLGCATYDEYLSRFMDEVKPGVLSVDNYPYFRPDRPDGRAVYCENLALMRKHALLGGIPFWIIFNSLPFGAHTDPTESQLRWQIYAALTYGAKGLSYFTYGTPILKGTGLVDRDGKLTRKWYIARRLNGEVKNLGPTLMQLTSTEVRRIGPNDYNIDTALAGFPLTRLGIEREPGDDPGPAKTDPPRDYLVGATGGAR